VSRKLEITGVVQGVGFRPFIYQLAQRYELNGFTLNDTVGVSVELEGEEGNIEAFMKALESELPPLSRIDTLSSEESEYMGHTDFQILQSETQDNKSALVSPDIAICENCLSEMQDPKDRRYNYPFINCTDCGIRLTVAFMHSLSLVLTVDRHSGY
jgi:hydrogenase maturation protein HypF